MAENLTGQFDVVAEFTVPAANRVLAAMHSVERFPHSLALRVDDTSRPVSQFPFPTVVGAVDAFGDPVANQQLIRNLNPLPGRSAATDPARSLLDQLINPNVVGAAIAPIVPSHLKGVAQIQVSPPVLELDDPTGANLSVRLDLMSRYLPDPQTAPLAEFIRGDLLLSAPLSQIAKQDPNIKAIDVNIKADSVGISFQPAWSSQPLDANDVAGINLAIRNALKTSFLPSNFALPSNVNAMQVKTLVAAPGALAALINMSSAAGDPNTFNSLFTRTGDDFAIGVGKDFVLSAFNSVTQSILSQPFPPIHFDVNLLLTTSHVTATISLTGVTVDLQEGAIVLTIQGHATTNKWWLPDFDFTVTQLFTLRLLGSTADLNVGALSITTSSSVVNLFIDNAVGPMEVARDQALAQSGAQGIVYQNLNSQTYLGGFLRSLLAPPHPPFNIIFPQPQPFTLNYTSSEIHTSGVILHGALAVSDWPSAHVEYEEIPTKLPQTVLGHDYSAFKSWIPGGTIQRFDWSHLGQSQPFLTDENKFVMIQPPLEVSDGNPSAAPLVGYVPLCLTLRGSRISSSGQEVAQPVVTTACGYTSLPIVTGLGASANELPALLALAQPGSQGQLVVTGHLSARLAATGAAYPNRLVYFADDKTSGNLDFLAQALLASKRTDSATALLAVLTADQISKARYSSGVIYADNRNGAWERVFGVKSTKRPFTLIVSPKGPIVWQQEGEIDSAALSAALAKFLVPGGAVGLKMLRSTLRIGAAPPNFLFEYAPDRQITLRKTADRSSTLVFWNSASQQSIDAVRDLQNSKPAAGGSAPLVLAINDGEPADVATKAAAANGLKATIVTDPQRQISFAYGVTIWPTIVALDASGIVRDIRYGRVAPPPGASAPNVKAAASH